MKTAIIEARKNSLENLSDIRLVEAIVKYFKKNKTMPGEKALKDKANTLYAEMKIGDGLLPEVRRGLIEAFASVLVKEVKLTNVAAVNNTKNADIHRLHANELPLAEVDTIINPVTNAKTVIYGMEGMIFADRVEYNTTEVDSKGFATLPAGFQKNYSIEPGMDIWITATDFSGGKFANMSYTMIIDLGQYLDRAA